MGHKIGARDVVLCRTSGVAGNEHHRHHSVSVGRPGCRWGISHLIIGHSLLGIYLLNGFSNYWTHRQPIEHIWQWYQLIHTVVIPGSGHVPHLIHLGQTAKAQTLCRNVRYNMISQHCLGRGLVKFTTHVKLSDKEKYYTYNCIYYELRHSPRLTSTSYCHRSRSFLSSKQLNLAKLVKSCGSH